MGEPCPSTREDEITSLDTIRRIVIAVNNVAMHKEKEFYLMHSWYSLRAVESREFVELMRLTLVPNRLLYFSVGQEQ
jgi:hypothetical protein